MLEHHEGTLRLEQLEDAGVNLLHHVGGEVRQREPADHVVVTNAGVEIEDADLVHGGGHLGPAKPLTKHDAELGIQLHHIEAITGEHPRNELLRDRTHARADLEHAQGAIPVHRAEDRRHHRPGQGPTRRPDRPDGGGLLEGLLEETKR